MGKNSGHDFELVSGAGVQAVIALDEQTRPELEAHEPWEYLDFDEDEDEAVVPDEVWEHLERTVDVKRKRTNRIMSYAEAATAT